MKRRHGLRMSLLLLLPPWLTLLAPSPARAALLERGDRVPWPQVTLLDGSRLEPEQLADHAVVVVFFTTSCPFCRRHLAHLQQLHRQATAAGLPLTVLAVARETDPGRVRRHVQAMGYGFAVTADHEPLAALLASRNLVPLTATVGRDGRLLQVLPGEMAEADTMALLSLATAPAARP